MNIHDQVPAALQPAISSYRLTLRAEKKKPKTVKIYTDACAFLASTLTVASWDQVTRTHIKEHLAALGETHSASYCLNQFMCLGRFFKFLEAEEGIQNPMAGMKAPKVEQKLVPVFKEGDFDLLLSTCRATDFTSVRDTAIIRLFYSSGCRLSELAHLTVNEVFLDTMQAIVHGKTGPRIVRFDAKTAVALDRYLKLRNKQKTSKQQARTSNLLPSPGTSLWLGQRGPLQENAILKMLARRGSSVGLHVHAHRFRHDFSHRYLLNGGAEGDLMQQNGWHDHNMLRRYGASAAAVRAALAYDRVMG